jgi:LysM repeat protein
MFKFIMPRGIRSFLLPAVVAVFIPFPRLLADTMYTVKSHDTLASIARKHDLSVETLAGYNRLSDPDKLSIGQKLAIPSTAPKNITHVVSSGETLSSIAARYGRSVTELKSLNNLKNVNRLSIGQKLLIPTYGRSGTVSVSRYPRLPDSVKAGMNKIRVSRRWRYIVIHHSATTTGNVESFDKNHRKRGMENGLAYHFVIGNGRGMGDGEIAIGHRWRGQLNGGHLSDEQLNTKSIGICLVGNFNNTKPTKKQVESLAALLDELSRETGLAKSSIKTHQDINTKPTACPGKHLKLSSVLSEF